MLPHGCSNGSADSRLGAAGELVVAARFPAFSTCDAVSSFPFSIHGHRQEVQAWRVRGTEDGISSIFQHDAGPVSRDRVREEMSAATIAEVASRALPLRLPPGISSRPAPLKVKARATSILSPSTSAQQPHRPTGHALRRLGVDGDISTQHSILWCQMILVCCCSRSHGTTQRAAHRRDARVRRRALCPPTA